MKVADVPTFTVEEISPLAAPLALLLEADPSEQKIAGYLARSLCFVACSQGAVVAVCLIVPSGDGVYELINMAVEERLRGFGIGSELLRHVIGVVRQRGAQRLEVGTATFGDQLVFYQRAGFRACGVVRDFFLDNYPEPLFEAGIQHKDMLRLALDC